MTRLIAILRANLVAVISLLFAAGSFAFAPTEGWWRAIDFRTLNLLFCLMFVVAGARSCNLFRVTAQSLLTGCKSSRALAHLLVQLTFFLSMLVTNDVALIALVPFAIYLLDRLNLRRQILAIVLLQTIAANLGSMATPMGNPQNLFLYTAHAIPAFDFFALMIPVTLAGDLLLLLATHLLGSAPIRLANPRKYTLSHPRKVALCAALFALCLLTVFRILPGGILFAIVLASALLFARAILRAVDYGLLLTFVGFFIFSHNIGQIPALRDLLTQLLESHPQTIAILASQILSNVPAAILLSPFTSNWQGLLLGVDIGAFGTPIASLASLISLNAYLREPDARPVRYLLLFLLINLLFLLPLCALTLLLPGTH